MLNGYDSNGLQKECESIRNSIEKALSDFRSLGVDSYCAEMWFKKLFVQDQFDRLKNFLNALIAEQIITTTERFGFISDSTSSKIPLNDQSDLIEDFKENLEYVICVQSEIDYKIELSRYTGYRLIRSEEKKLKHKQDVELLESIFMKNVNYLKEKGNEYAI